MAIAHGMPRTIAVYGTEHRCSITGRCCCAHVRQKAFFTAIGGFVSTTDEVSQEKEVADDGPDHGPEEAVAQFTGMK